MRIICSAIVAVFSASTFCYASQLAGTVKSASGEPLSKVRIYSRSENQIGAIERYLTTSDEQGRFNLLIRGKVVFFRLPGFRPIAKILQGNEDHIDVVMEIDKTPGPPIPNCPSGFNSEVYVGPGKVGYRLPIPSGVLMEQSRGDHDLSYTVYYKQRGNKEALVYYWSWTLIGFPKEELILESREFSIQSFGDDKYGALDVRGRFGDGTYWRSIVSDGTQISYERVSKEAADYFDAIINGVCIAL